MKEIRSYRAELRLGGDSGAIEGYAAKYNVLSHEIDGFIEVLMPGAFAEAVNDDCTCNRDHDDAKLLGRTTSGTLQLTDDETGLHFICQPPDTEAGRETSELLRRGDLNACSFCFDVLEEEWATTPEGLPLRQVKRVKLYDVSIVVFAAYPQTEVALRSLAKWREQQEEQEQQAEQTKPVEEPAGIPVSLRKKIIELQKKEFCLTR